MEVRIFINLVYTKSEKFDVKGLAEGFLIFPVSGRKKGHASQTENFKRDIRRVPNFAVTTSFHEISRRAMQNDLYPEMNAAYKSIN